MTILKMRLKGDKICIKTSSDYVFTIPKNGTYELDIYEGMELEFDDIPYLRLRAYEAAAKKCAISILKRGFISEGMLRDKMRIKGHKNRFINFAIQYCKEYELLDDKRFVRLAISSLRLKGKSNRHILDYLKKAKISSRLIEKSKNKLSDEGEIKLLKEAIRKYYKVYEHKEKQEEYMIKALMRKGFKYDSIKSLVSRYIKNQKRKK